MAFHRAYMDHTLRPQSASLEALVQAMKVELTVADSSQM